MGRVSLAKELAGGMGRGKVKKKLIARVQAHFSSPHSSRRFSVLCPLPKQVSLLEG